MQLRDLRNNLAGRSAEKADRISREIPMSTQPGTYRVKMEMLAPDGTTPSPNHTDITLR